MNKYLIGILALAAFLRLFLLGSVPASLYWEETALGYDAYSIWKTGKDFHGNVFPIVAFESFGDFKPSGYFYLAAPFVGLFGLNNWSIRLPSALAGILTVWLVYMIGNMLFRDKRTALWSAFVLAILPWHIQFSRAAFEVNVATMWLSLGVLLLLKARSRISYVWPAGLAFVFSMYTYHGLRVLAPLIAALIGWMYLKKQMLSPRLIGAVLVCVGLLLPLVLNIRNPVVNQRFAETSLFSTSPAVSSTNALRAVDGNTMWSRMLHHRYWEWGKEIISGALSHFSPKFLFFAGDGNQRHQTGHTGLFYWWTVLPLFFVIGKRSWKKDAFEILFILLWVVLATIPPALTNASPHTLRFLPAAPAAALLIGFALSQLIAVKHILFRLVICGLIAGEGFLYGFDYFTSYAARSSVDWQYGYEQLIHYIASRPNTQEYVQVTRAYGRPSMYFLYYLGYDPRLIQQQAEVVPKDQGELLAFDRFTFGPLDLSKKGLFVSDVPLSLGTLVKQIDSPTNKPVFYVYEIK